MTSRIYTVPVSSRLRVRSNKKFVFVCFTILSFKTDIGIGLCYTNECREAKGGEYPYYVGIENGGFYAQGKSIPDPQVQLSDHIQIFISIDIPNETATFKIIKGETIQKFDRIFNLMHSKLGDLYPCVTLGDKDKVRLDYVKVE